MILKPIIAKNPTEFRINYTFIYFHQLKFNVQTTKIIHGEKKKMRKDCQFYDSLKHFTQCPTNPICFAKRIHGKMERNKIYRNKYNYLQFIADIQNETFRNYDD